MDDRNLDAVDEKRLPRDDAPDDFEAHRLHGDVSDKRLSEPTAGRDEEADDFEAHRMHKDVSDRRYSQPLGDELEVALLRLGTDEWSDADGGGGTAAPPLRRGAG